MFSKTEQRVSSAMLAAGLKQGRLVSGRVAQPYPNLLRFSHSTAAIARFTIALRLTN